VFDDTLPYRSSYKGFSTHIIYTIKTRSEFRNVSVTVTVACCWWAGPQGPAHRGWLGVVDTCSQPVASRRLTAGCLTCCYSRQATRQVGLRVKHRHTTDISYLLALH